ncbi:U32 family peptidase, partial [Vibrio sp. YT-18]|nr:U32 family peptidase [Vibrio sp. YT-18]
LDRFRSNEQGSDPDKLSSRQCNGYWHQLAGLEVKNI